jgi:hypothetical protein
MSQFSHVNVDVGIDPSHALLRGLVGAAGYQRPSRARAWLIFARRRQRHCGNGPLLSPALLNSTYSWRCVAGSMVPELTRSAGIKLN